jgi:hypothetical protein
MNITDIMPTAGTIEISDLPGVTFPEHPDRNLSCPYTCSYIDGEVDPETVPADVSPVTVLVNSTYNPSVDTGKRQFIVYIGKNNQVVNGDDFFSSNYKYFSEVIAGILKKGLPSEGYFRVTFTNEAINAVHLVCGGNRNAF